ncbi:MAG: MFS transporter [Pseudonocardia sp.]|nr:MFS transporter [Pseudonocardia sp.]
MPGRDMGMLRRMTWATAIGEGLDGFDLGIIAVVLPLITTDLGLTPVWSGLIAASTLVGIFFGSPLVGTLADRIGRRTLFTIDIGAFVLLGLLQAVVTEPWQLLVVRLLLGVAVGAEYAIGAAMLSEFAPAKDRGRRLAGMLVTWYGGYLVSVILAYGLVELGGLSWRWVLATSVVPALITLAARFGLPESPHWLMGRGRVEEARAIADRYLGGQDYFREEGLDDEQRGEAAGGLRRLFAPGMRGRTLFVCTFYACNVAPYFAIFTFAPQVFAALQINNEAASTILANAIAVAGAVVGMLTIERIGRRQQLIGPFWIMAVALLVVGLWSGAPPLVIVTCFAAFAFTNALQGNLTAVYPAEVFPTELRSTGIGFSTAFSRIGAASGTFLLPIGISAIGVGPCMVIAAVICLIGGTVSQFMAPETTGLSLSRTTGLRPATA